MNGVSIQVERHRVVDRLALAGRSTPAPIFRGRNSYDAAQTVRRTLGWRAPEAFPNDVLYSLNTLRARSRAATRNDGWAKSIIDKLVANIVGTGIKPLAKAMNKAFRKQVQDLFTRWTDESDADGLLDFYGQETQAVRGWMEAGESFVRLRPRYATDGLSVPLQLQVIEPEHVPHTFNVLLPNGNRVRAGIEFNAIGRRVAHWFYASRPGDFQDLDTSQLRRVPADLVVHLYDPLRAGQLRGLPQLTQALIRLFEFKKYDDATLLRQQLTNMFAGFLKRAPGADTDLHPLTGETPDTTYGRKPLVTMEPGTFQELEAGEDVVFSEPPDAGSTYKDFMRQQLMSAAASAGVPYELVTGDMSGLNDRVVRVLLNEFTGRLEIWQHQIVAHQFCRPIWNAWMYAAYLGGALPIPDSYLEDPEPYRAVRWTPPRRRYIHPVQDVEAQLKEIDGGLTSRSATVSERGDDAEVIDEEQKADHDREQLLGLNYQSSSAAASTRPPANPDDLDEGTQRGATA